MDAIATVLNPKGSKPQLKHSCTHTCQQIDFHVELIFSDVEADFLSGDLMASVRQVYWAHCYKKLKLYSMVDR